MRGAAERDLMTWIDLKVAMARFKTAAEWQRVDSTEETFRALLRTTQYTRATQLPRPTEAAPALTPRAAQASSTSADKRARVWRPKETHAQTFARTAEEWEAKRANLEYCNTYNQPVAAGGGCSRDNCGYFHFCTYCVRALKKPLVDCCHSRADCAPAQAAGPAPKQATQSSSS